MRYAVLRRKYTEHATLGSLTFHHSPQEGLSHSPLDLLYTVELPWRDNQKRISCIPEGTYYCRPRYSDKHENHFILDDVPGRELILIHVANYTRELLGCIAPGLKHADIDSDRIMDVTSSRAAMERILWHGDYWGHGFILKIESNK